MNAIDMEKLLGMRRHLRIVHHVPGRVRIRIGAALYGQASALNANGLRSFLESVDGVHDMRINPAAASLVIQYDPKYFPPELWETLVAGSDQVATQLIGELIAKHEHHQLTGVQQ